MRCELSFVELAVLDHARSVAWYTNILGLQVLHEDERRGWVLLSAGTGRLAIKTGSPKTAGVGLAFEVDDVTAWAGHLRAKGVVLDGDVTTNDEGYRRVHLRDPDGHILTLFDWQRTP